MRRCLFFVLLVIAGRSATAQDFSLYQKKHFAGTKASLPYRMLYPKDFDSSKAYPLVVFLHGANEKGDDNESQLAIGGRFFLRDSIRNNYPAVVIFPQCPLNDSWVYFDVQLDSVSGLVKKWRFPFKRKPTDITQSLKELMDGLLKEKYIDTSRLYIGGLSQGAMGVLDIIARYPGMFNAAFAICGAGDITSTKYFANKTAVWLFHGEKDDIVQPTFSRDFYKRLQKLGGDTRYSEFPGVYHNSWNNAFAEKELMQWLFSKQKK